MSDFVNTIDLIGDEAVTKALVERTITEFNDDVITTVGNSTFYNCTALTSVDLPNVTSIDFSSFYGCSFTSVNLPNVTNVGGKAISSCPNLTSINLPNLLQENSSNAFSSNPKLASVNIPRCNSLGMYCFSVCSTLSFLDLPSVKSIGNYCFSNASALKTIVLRSEKTCTLSNKNAFNNTPFASDKAGGTLLVPRSLTASYQTATNWSSIFSGNANNRVLALEDYTVDGTITGEIDWDKLGGTT